MITDVCVFPFLPQVPHPQLPAELLQQRPEQRLRVPHVPGGELPGGLAQPAPPRGAGVHEEERLRGPQPAQEVRAHRARAAAPLPVSSSSSSSSVVTRDLFSSGTFTVRPFHAIWSVTRQNQSSVRKSDENWRGGVEKFGFSYTFVRFARFVLSGTFMVRPFHAIWSVLRQNQLSVRKSYGNCRGGVEKFGFSSTFVRFATFVLSGTFTVRPFHAI
ncbi:hypothetical protein AVEN_67050-1 [Araneus ventricosus]|uniref:Uncharacterized protein n=1 Tax=Araneus ventricosus TaxID=182803 RepID=A0A4Y2G7G9_ARAVE|nr:hypothetical protein AVEN_67050-1 [Araneus ventricosus]